MNDERKKQLLEQRDEIDMMLLTEACMASEGAAILAKYEEAEKQGEVSDVPDELDAKCRQIIQTAYVKQEQKRVLAHVTTYIRKIAVYILLLLGAASTLILSVDALRVPVLNFILNRSERASSLVFDNTQFDKNAELEKFKDRVVPFIPKDYPLLHEHIEENGTVLLTFQNDAGNSIFIKTFPAKGTANIDTETADTTEIELNGYRAFLVEKDGYCVYWVNEEIGKIFSIYADNLSLDRFWEIVYSLAA